MASALGAFIRNQRGEVLKRWLGRVRAYQHDHTDAELMEGMPAFIDVLSAAVDAADGSSCVDGGKSSLAVAHGRQRFRQGFALNIIVRDYGSISDVVGELGGESQCSFDAREYQAFNLCLDAAIASAVDEYWHEARARDEYLYSERSGMVAHELRNALSSAMMALDVLEEGRVGIHSTTGNVLRRSLRRLNYLVDQVVAAALLGSNRTRANERIIANTWIRELVDAVVLERGIHIDVQVDRDLTFYGDPRLLGAAVSNLLHNAVKFSHKDATVVLRATGGADGIRIEVADECGGLAPEMLEQLFRPFVQGGADRRGMGLGLAISREAAEAHRGTIAVENRPPVGCAFVIALPNL
jgi:signal transduction histidine kinase